MIFKSYRLTLIIIFFSFFCVFFVNNRNVYSSGLKSSIQKELDSNPFLKNENIKLKVVEEENGYLTIKMLEGNREIREAIDDGEDLNAIESNIFYMGDSKTLRKNFSALKKAINYVKTMDGVKEVLLTSSVNSPTDLYQDGGKYLYKRNYKEAINLWTKSADSGFDYAQSALSYMYWEGLGVDKDYNTAVNLAKKAAEQNNAYAQAQMAFYYLLGNGVKKDYASAISWGKKSAEQGNSSGYAYLAWIYATATNEKYIDAEKALNFAKKAISLRSEELNPESFYLVRILAAAHAINNNFEKALSEQQKAINLLIKHRYLPQEKIREKLFEENERLQAYMIGHLPWTNSTSERSKDIASSITCGAYVAPGIWKEFDCYNLAAIGKTTNDDPFTPSWRLIGGYWQWGRKGPEPSQWYDTNTPNFAHGPTGPDAEDANSGEISGWHRQSAPDGAWSDSNKTVNDPCPDGFRVPTQSHWQGVLDNNTPSFVGTWSSASWYYTNYTAAILYGDALMLPAAGGRHRNDGALSHRGDLGYYWASSEGSSSGLARRMAFFSDYSGTKRHRTNRTYGFSVRCISE